jgi:hypothetical protein
MYSEIHVTSDRSVVWGVRHTESWEYNMPIRRMAKIGKAENVIVPDTLSYVAALSVLIRDLKGTGITFDPDIFYSEDAVELDHPVSSLVYTAIHSSNCRNYNNNQ